MNVEITLTDDIKRAARYLGLSKSEIEKEINRQCSDFFENLVSRAKRKYLKTKTMEDIDPEPLT